MCSAEEIRDEWSEYDVVDVKWITKLENGERKNTTALLVSFAQPKLPTDIMAGYLELEVRPYAPPPTRCYRCQRFGHVQSKCKKGETCSECGRPAHGKSCCKKKSCVNCKGQHSARSEECPAWKNRQAIQQLMVVSRVSRKEARRRVLEVGTSTTATSSLRKAARENSDNKEMELLKTNLDLQDSVQRLSTVIQQQQQQLSQLSAKLGEAMLLMKI